MTDSSSTRQQQAARCSLMLASVLVVQLSSAHSSSASASASLNVPLRIGVQSSLQLHQKSDRRRFSSLFATTTKPSSTSGSNYQQTSEESDAFYDEEEWKALFQNEFDNDDHKQATYAATRRFTTTTAPLSYPHDTTTTTSGFRNRLQLPAFLARRRNEEVISYSDYEEAAVIPCAAVAVSNKISGTQASFSPALHSRPPKKSAPQIHRKSLQSTTAAAAAAAASSGRPLVFWENMVCGAISRSVAQTVMHPANTMKTLLQQSNAAPIGSYLTPQNFPVLFRGAGANLILSIPTGAINFGVLELVRKELSRVVRATKYTSEEKIGPALDFMSSAISTICCSVVSTPQMMITDNIMAGNYNNIPHAVRQILSEKQGIKGLYSRGWWPGLVGKIPSYALTWTTFQQLKEAQKRLSGREATNLENAIMGCVASGTTVTIMIPLDTVKTRLVTQATRAGVVPYKGIVDCAVRVAREEGVKAFYRGLPPRLISVVPMIGIQFTVYEFMKRAMQRRALASADNKPKQQQLPPTTTPIPVKPLLSNKRKSRSSSSSQEKDFDPYSSVEQLQECSMEVAASQGHPYPAPHFLRVMKRKNNNNNNKNGKVSSSKKKEEKTATVY